MNRLIASALITGPFDILTLGFTHCLNVDYKTRTNLSSVPTQPLEGCSCYLHFHNPTLLKETLCLPSHHEAALLLLPTTT